MPSITEFYQDIDACPLGMPGWSQFEDLCTRILEYLFVPPLTKPTKQARTFSGVSRRDSIFPNRNITQPVDASSKNWYHLYSELNARMILFEFKNYDSSQLGHEEVNQTRNYLTSTIGKLGIIISSKDPEHSAIVQRNSTYTQDKKVILFMNKEHLKEMLAMKERGDEPSDLILDLLELFYIQHE